MVEVSCWVWAEEQVQGDRSSAAGLRGGGGQAEERWPQHPVMEALTLVGEGQRWKLKGRQQAKKSTHLY